MNWRDHIVTDTKVLCGKPVIKGTRLSVEFLLGLMAQGWTTTQILESYPQISTENLQALFAFSAECVKDEEFVITHAPSLA